MMQETRIRLATLDDLMEITAVIRESIRLLNRQNYSPEQVASAVKYAPAIDLSMINDGTYFVATVGETLVGCGGWSRFRSGYDETGNGRLDPQTDPAKIVTLYVHPDWARRGVGGAILQRAEAAAATDGFRQLWLLATLTAEPFYRQHGYQEVGRRPVYQLDGTPFECVEMVKALNMNGA